MSIVYGSVCSGIEAASAAWHPLGWEASFFSEIEAFPRAVLTHYYPKVPLHGDFTTIQAGQYRPIDLLVGGTPCQSFSIAGLRGGLSDRRGNLTLEYLLLAERLRPRWLVWENVPGVFSSLSHDAPDPREPEDNLDGDNGPADGEEVVVEDEYDTDESHAFACLLAGLSELGYGFAYRVLDAQYAGVPQRRRRVFVVGYLGDWRRAAAVLLERHSLSGNSPPSREARTLVAALTANGVGTCGADDNQGQAGHLIPTQVVGALTSAHGPNGHGGSGLATDKGAEAGHIIPVLAFGGNNTRGPIDVSTTLNSHGGPHGRLDFESETFVAIPFDTTQITSAANRSNPQPGDCCHPIVANGHPPSVAFSIMPMNSGKDFKARLTEVAQPLMAGGPVGGNQDGDFVVDAPAFAIQERAVSENTESGPDGVGIRSDDVAYTIEARSVPQAVAFALRGREGGAMPEVEGDGDVVGALRAASGGSTRDYVGFSNAGYFGQMQEADIADPLRAKGGDTGNGGETLVAQSAVRRLTPTECERLQGFSDGYTDVPFRGKQASDGPRYKALGNSMAVPVMAWIGARIEAVEAMIRRGDLSDAS